MSRMSTGRPSGESGLGLPDLLMTMLLMGLLGSMVLALVVSMDRTFTRVRARADSTSVAASAMNELTRTIRSATTVPGAGPDGPVLDVVEETEIVLYVIAPGTDPRHPEAVRVRFAVEPGRGLVEERWDVGSIPTSDPDTTRTLARTGEVRFTFGGAGGTVPDGPEDVTTVGVSLTVAADADTTEPAAGATLRHTVAIPHPSVPE